MVSAYGIPGYRHIAAKATASVRGATCFRGYISYTQVFGATDSSKLLATDNSLAAVVEAVVEALCVEGPQSVTFADAPRLPHG
jgi:PII-like signaling protein